MALDVKGQLRQSRGTCPVIGVGVGNVEFSFGLTADPHHPLGGWLWNLIQLWDLVQMT